jgi:hypothetical protein
MWFGVAAVSAIDAFTTLTGWANFAHHDNRHGLFALPMAVAFASIGWYSIRRGC